MKTNEMKEIKASEVMKDVKEMKLNELIKFRKQFYKYCLKAIEGLGGTYAATSTSVINTQVTPVVHIADNMEQPVVEVKEDWTIGKNSSWKNFLGQVKTIGTKMGDPTEKEGVMLSAKKDSNVGIVAALVGHRGYVTNMVWGTCYELPILFAKCTKAELEEYANQILSNPPEGYQPAKHLANGQFYYDELQTGNFICRIYDKNAGCFKHFGYIVDEDVVFWINKGGDIECNALDKYFVKNWGHRPSKENAILKLLERADFEEISAVEKDEYVTDFNQFNNTWTTSTNNTSTSSNPMLEDNKEEVKKEQENSKEEEVKAEYEKQQEVYLGRVDFEENDYEDDEDDEELYELLFGDDAIEL